MKFKLEIKLGNDAMSSPEDVAAALQYVVNRQLSRSELQVGMSRPIPDENGNTVGEWKVTR